ncbi:hypothetical protein DV737_g5714, partial [Chaetothyriales sp. CBS 132003]
MSEHLNQLTWLIVEDLHGSFLAGLSTYEAEVDAAYDLVRIGKVTTLANTRLGPLGGKIVEEIALQGSLPASQIAARINDALPDGEKVSALKISRTLAALTADGFLRSIRPAHLHILHDAEQDIDFELGQRLATNSKTKGKKAQQEHAILVKTEMERRLDYRVNAQCFDDLGENETGPATKNRDEIHLCIDFNVVVRYLREVQVSRIVEKALSPAAARVARAVIEQIDFASPLPDHLTDPLRLPTSQTLTFSRLRDSLARTARPPTSNGTGHSNGHVSESALSNGIDHEEDAGMDRSSFETSLSLISEGPFPFLFRDSLTSTWNVDALRVSRWLRDKEIDTLINQRVGTIGLRVKRMLVDKGKLEEKHLQELGLFVAKELRQTLAQLATWGMVELQEVPREPQRQPNRTMFLWFFDHERAKKAMLGDLYKTMARLFQVLHRGREILKGTLEKIARAGDEYDLDKSILLFINYACAEAGIKIPFARVAELMGPRFSEGAIVQHIAKVRSKMQDEKEKTNPELLVPPPNKRGSVTKPASAMCYANTRQRNTSDFSDLTYESNIKSKRVKVKRELEQDHGDRDADYEWRSRETSSVKKCKKIIPGKQPQDILTLRYSRAKPVADDDSEDACSPMSTPARPRRGTKANYASVVDGMSDNEESGTEDLIHGECSKPGLDPQLSVRNPSSSRKEFSPNVASARDMPRPARRAVTHPREGEANTPTRQATANAITAAIPPFMLDTPPHAPFVTTPVPPSNYPSHSIVPEQNARRQALGQQQTPTANGHHDPGSSQASTSVAMPESGNHDDRSLVEANQMPEELKELEGLRDISSLATWTLSSAKPGCALPQLRHPSPNHFWQSDGPQPHTLTLHFFKLVAIVKMRIYLDFELDESYTPTKIKFYAGMSEGGLVEFGSWQVMEIIDPETGEARSTIEDVKGWIDVPLEGVGGRESRYHEAVDESIGEDIDEDTAPGDVLKAMVVQVRICENHQNADRTAAFQRSEKLVDETAFTYLCLLALASGAATVRLNCRVKSINDKSQDDQAFDLLPRQQTEEWKGWMQIAILLYHYFGMSRILHVYRLIRILVGSYLFLTGYGHTVYLLRTNDFSLYRVVGVVTRLNLLASLLPFVMGSKYDMYYFPALSTFWFLITWAVVPRTDGTLPWHTILMRILFAVFSIELLLSMPTVWHNCAYLIRAAGGVDLDTREFLFRLSLDRFVPYVGILTACANEHLRRSMRPACWSRQFNQIAVVAGLCLVAAYLLFLPTVESKEESNRYHPVMETVPIIAFVLVRNSHPALRKCHSRLFSWVGRHSLETFVLQYHIWLAADAKKILSISWGADPPLASHGVQQAEETGLFLAEKLFEAAASDRLRIYSSLFYRCLETLRPTVRLLQAKLDGSNSGPRRQVLVRGERGMGEWFGRAWFTHPSPATPQRLKADFFPWLDDKYESMLIPDEKGERIEELHKRLSVALELLINDVDEEYASQGRGEEEVTVLICGHAAQIIATGRALTGLVPDDYDEEDFRCYTCGISRFVRRQPPTGDGVLGAWDCVGNSDCTHLTWSYKITLHLGDVRCSVDRNLKTLAIFLPQLFFACDFAQNAMSPGGKPLPSCPEQYGKLISSLVSELGAQRLRPRQPRRYFHDYFITHLPSSSLHPDSRSVTGLAHKLPRQDSTPHTPDGKSAPAAHPSISRDTTVVRIPLVSAKHHYGAAVSRGRRPYNEDAHQAGVIEVPAFAKKPPASVRVTKVAGESVGGESASGDPQVFYFGIFDGHGGAECSAFLRERLHSYIEKTADEFGFHPGTSPSSSPSASPGAQEGSTTSGTVKALEQGLVAGWKDLVGGYFKRFKPAYFSLYDGHGAPDKKSEVGTATGGKGVSEPVRFEEVLAYSFLKADYDFIAAQAAKKDGGSSYSDSAERPLNDGDILDQPNKLADHIGGPTRFKGGSTCSVVMVSTPSPAPFWHPATTSTMLVAHVGDTRVLICSTSTGAAMPLTSNHHPSSPVEGTRLRRYAATFVTDSFGEERISGLANTRAFGDINSKRIGVSAEPEIRRIELGVAEYSFLVLVSDGVSGTLSDQEIVDIVKEAKNPDQAARNVVDFATEVSMDGDNTTCIVVRLGGWERRQEGGHGSLGTAESRRFKRDTAADPRSSRHAAMPDTLQPNGHAHTAQRRLSVTEAMEKLDKSIYKQENIFLFIPNIIGYVRIVLAFASLYYMPVHPRTCSLLYSISCLLDALDGFAARRYNQSTTFGAVLDMVTDRCTTACLLVFLAQAFPRWSIVFQVLISLDLASHYIHMYAMLHLGGSGTSHKKVDEKRSWILHLYYTNRPGSPAYPKLSSLFPNPWSAGAMEVARSNKIDSTIPWILTGITFPVMVGKQVINVIQMLNASKMLGEADLAARREAKLAAAAKDQ